MRPSAFTVIAFATSGICMCYGASGPTTRSVSSSYPDTFRVAQLNSLLQMDESARNAALANMVISRQELEQSIIQELKDESDDRAASVTAYLAGFYRLDGLAAELVRRIGLENPDWNKAPIKGTLPLYGRFPACEALEKIGSKAIPALIENVEANDEQRTWALSLQVLIDIAGPDAAALLRRRLLQVPQSDYAKAHRLEAAIDRAGDLPPARVGG